MAKFVEVDVRGLSCPEPVLLTMDERRRSSGDRYRRRSAEAGTQGR